MAERNLLLRVASAVVGLPLLGGLVFWREPLGFGIFALVVVAVGLSEYFGMLLAGRGAGERALLVAIGTTFSAAIYFLPALAFPWFLAATVLGAVVTLVRADEVKAATARLTTVGFGFLYVGGLVVTLPLMHRDLPEGSRWVAFAIAVTFANDTGAYITGRALGRHKLAPIISPGKTVEGAVGGLVASLVVAFVARATFLPALTSFDAAAIGVAAGLLGPCGDLTESMIKRASGAKDSGRLIPGHGGILDRIDALMFVGAYVYVHTRLFH